MVFTKIDVTNLKMNTEMMIIRGILISATMRVDYASYQKVAALYMNCEVHKDAII